MSPLGQLFVIYKPRNIKSTQLFPHILSTLLQAQLCDQDLAFPRSLFGQQGRVSGRYKVSPGMCQESGTTARLQFQEWTALMIRPEPIQKIQPKVDICNRYRKLHPTGRCWTGIFLPWWVVNKTSSRTTTKLQDGDQSSSQYRERICLCHRSRLR